MNLFFLKNVIADVNRRIEAPSIEDEYLNFLLNIFEKLLNRSSFSDA